MSGSGGGGGGELVVMSGCQDNISRDTADHDRIGISDFCDN